MQITDKHIFTFVSSIVLSLLIIDNFEYDMLFLPPILLEYTTVLSFLVGIMWYNSALRDYKQMNYEDVVYFLSTVSAGWFVYILTTSKIIIHHKIHYALLFHFLGTFAFCLFYYLIFYCFGIVETVNYRTTPSSLLKNKNLIEVDPLEFMNETQLEAELNYLLKEQDFLKAKKVQEILNKKFSNN